MRDNAAMLARPVALVTGASRPIGLGAAIARALAASGWDIALSFWRAYDASMPWGSDPVETQSVRDALVALGARVALIEADLADLNSSARLFDHVKRELGPVSGLILAHCHGVDSDTVSTTPESFDQHYKVNVRGSWQLVREFGMRFTGAHGSGRIIALTSDHFVGNLPYGATKAALDRVIIAAAVDFRDKGITANVVNPGGIDTGYFTPDLHEQVRARTLLGRVGLPQDCANMVAFLCSPQGGWTNGQLLNSNGGIY